MNLQLKDNVIKVSGRIDSSNASDFEEQLWKLVSEVTSESNTEVKLDFDELIYISSAGLRVLLKLIQKNTQLQSRMSAMKSMIYLMSPAFLRC